ncbi:hypothetical protein [Bacillus velezensis]|uniref:hypothetical protein n=1 Tax=Bacillus velezensis TaxID=492670 RepID=UPI0007F91961|nr:hypothetical protein [Bacillus velezensis]AWQ15998.1 hypothetical protein C1N92_14615 [Bacillus velezensis]MEC0446387.1 hypothetical protein [Bacillus velezensis]OBR29832.1 hypothetical protein SRCM100731_03006 [Bacillus velezensis]OCB96105.1 hypothetical protein SRCM100730_02650 [Bacillus velezensis]QMI87123.1 hypothetical protein H1Q60_13195 [Bacillus velezensis]
MNKSMELAVSLVIIIIINITLIIYINKRLNRGVTVKEGIEVGSEFPVVMAENIEGDYSSIKKEKARLFIFIDLECSECMKLFSSLKVYQKSYLDGIIFILIKSNLNKKLISKSSIKDQALFIEEQDILGTYNISSLPFFIGISHTGIVTQRGYISKHNLVDFIA